MSSQRKFTFAISSPDEFLVKTVYRVHTGVNTVQIKTEAAGSDITEYLPPNDKPSSGMFGFLCTFLSMFLLCLFMFSFHTCAMHGKLLSVARVVAFIVDVKY